VLALEVLKEAEVKLDAAKAELAKASETVSNCTGTNPAERANLELKRERTIARFAGRGQALSNRQGFGR
jgi:hypothetical protein